jgi:transcriptional regulator with XRE-family HTH domain
MKIFAKRLKNLREQQGLSQRELAKHVKIAHSTLGMYEIGEREPDFDIVSRLATFLNTSIDYLLGRTDDPRPVNDIKQSNAPDLNAPLQEQNLADALCKISELIWEFHLDDETIKTLIKKAVDKYGPPDMEKGGLAAHGPNYPGSGIFGEGDEK